MTYSIKIQDGSTSLVDIDINDPDIAKKLVAAAKTLNKRLATLRGMAISPIMAVADDDIEALALDAFTTFVNYIVQHGPQQMAMPGVAAPAVVAPAAPPVAAPVAPALLGTVPLVTTASPIGTSAVGVPPAFTPTTPPAGGKGPLARLRRK